MVSTIEDVQRIYFWLVGKLELGSDFTSYFPW